MKRDIQGISPAKNQNEYIQYTGMEIDISCLGETFQVLNLAKETMYRSIPGHRHGNGDWEFHLITSGKGLIGIEDEERFVTRGDWFLVGPLVEHFQISDKNEPMTEQTIYFHLKEKRRDSSLNELFSKAYCFGAKGNIYLGLCDRIIQEMDEKKKGYTDYVRLLLEQLILELWREDDINQQYKERSLRDNNQEYFPSTDLERMQDFIVEKAFLYSYYNLTLDKLAKEVGLSKRQLQRHLRQRYNSTFIEMRSQARMWAAKMLLGHTDMNILTISEEVGYSTPEHFTAVFTEAEGMSPRDYRNQNRL